MTVLSGPDAAGWLSDARRLPSENHDERPPGSGIALIVLHAISLPPGEFGGDGIERLFTNRLDAVGHPYYAGLRGLRVSSHFFIRRDGELIQFVSCAKRAWHAGVSCWRGRQRCNDFSIGIELEGCDELPFSERQYAELARLLAVLRQAYGKTAIVGHGDIAPGRKTDPGPHFDWHHLYELLGE